MSIETERQAVVVDASLAASWVLPEPNSARALSLADEWAREDIDLFAPSLMPAEVASALYKRMRRGELLLGQAQEALDVVLGFGVRIEDEPGLHQRALSLAHRCGLPQPYDALYLALAESRSCELWTGDERLYNTVRAQLPWVRWIGAYNTAGA